ncbi:MAG: YbaK/EbsC family protein [Synergistaceae bacterium]|nr:YbaK/EbsC family protein [Synergistota bacterium]NLM72039.1 YbaK/EbsC family protein [Synergistaceae bacterium]
MHTDEDRGRPRNEDRDPVMKVREFLEERGHAVRITYSDDTIFTVEDASRVVGAREEEILKSLVLLVDDVPVLALMSGVNKMDVKKVRSEMGARKVRMADPDYVLKWSGFQIGGVPPVGYPEAPQALLDEDLFQHKRVWAAAGTDHSFFPVSPEDLLRLTGGRRCSLKK